MKLEKYIPAAALLISLACTGSCNSSIAEKKEVPVNAPPSMLAPVPADKAATGIPPLDTALYNTLQLHLVHDKPNSRWPVRAAYPLPALYCPLKE